MLEKFFTTISLLFIVSLAFSSCQPKDKFDWSAGWSAPKYYGSAPMIGYYYKGKGLAGASAGIGADPGWGMTSGGYVGGDKFKDVPDSLYVHYIDAPDGYEFEGGFKLPREKMLELFKEGFRDSENKKQNYTVIVTGMAPGGNVTLWLQGGRISKEIAKFKAINKGVWKENDEHYRKFENEVITSKDFKNSEANIFRNLHGIPYKVWEVGEKEYNYNIVFSSKEDYKYALTFYSKDGSVNQIDKSTNLISWKDRFNTKNSIATSQKLPVQIHIQWYSKNESRWFNGDIIMPNNLEQVFKTGNFKRILISVEKDSGNTSLGEIYFVGNGTQKKIMTFQLPLYNYTLKKLTGPKYSLPKGFVFPKWEGRIPISLPDNFEYYQEP